MLRSGDKVGITACSNPLTQGQRGMVEELKSLLCNMDLTPVCWEGLYREKVSGRERADAVNACYRDPKIRAVFDVSGGDLANETLEYLDYEAIRRDPKPFWGYSDLTVILNAIYVKTGLPSFLYQIRNLCKSQAAQQQDEFRRSVMGGQEILFQPSWTFCQGDKMEGVVVGGNIRCFLKLAGTPYMPDLKGKLLFLESLGGGEEQIRSLLCQLKLTGAFSRIGGLLLGTFTRLEEDKKNPSAAELVLEIAQQPELPVAVTGQVGHGGGSKCLKIGSRLLCCR